MVKRLLAFILAFASFSVFAQHTNLAAHHPESSNKGKHQVTLGLGHTHLFEGVKEGNTKWMDVPSWTADYNYWLSGRLAVGLHTDIVTETFFVKTVDGDELERETPFAVIPCATYKFGKHLNLVGGVGREFEPEVNLTLLRLGAEYGWELPGDFELSVGLMWDTKIKHYDSWVLSVNVSKLFAPKHH